MINPELMKKSQDELLVEIGRALAATDLTALPQTPEQLKRHASRWLDTHWEAIRQRLCSNDKVRQLANDGFTAELTAAVLGLLESLSLGSAVTPLAVLLCRRGLRNVCSDHWNQR